MLPYRVGSFANLVMIVTKNYVTKYDGQDILGDITTYTCKCNLTFFCSSLISKIIFLAGLLQRYTLSVDLLMTECQLASFSLLDYRVLNNIYLATFKKTKSKLSQADCLIDSEFDSYSDSI